MLCRSGSTAGEFCRIGTFKCGQPQRKDDLVDDDAYHEFLRELEGSRGQVARSVCSKVSWDAERSKEVFTVTVI